MEDFYKLRKKGHEKAWELMEEYYLFDEDFVKGFDAGVKWAYEQLKQDK